MSNNINNSSEEYIRSMKQQLESFIRNNKIQIQNLLIRLKKDCKEEQQKKLTRELNNLLKLCETASQ